MDVALTILALLAGGLVVELFTASRAPMGYQDENGFHFGTAATNSPDRSVLSTKPHRHAPVERPLEPVAAS